MHQCWSGRLLWENKPIVSFRSYIPFACQAFLSFLLCVCFYAHFTVMGLSCPTQTTRIHTKSCREVGLCVWGCTPRKKQDSHPSNLFPNPVRKWEAKTPCFFMLSVVEADKVAVAITLPLLWSLTIPRIAPWQPEFKVIPLSAHV